MGRRGKMFSRKRKKDMWGFFLIVLVIFITVTFGIILLSAKSKTTTLDRKTLCPAKGIVGKTAILIDRTDPLTNMQQQELKIYLNDIKTSIPIHAAISIYGMDKAMPDRIEPEIYLCNPGKGENKSPWLSNPALIKKVWQKKFSNQLDDIINRLMEPLEIPNSPIMEAIKAVAISEFIGEDNKGISKHLVIVSDMMQHTPLYSHYRKRPNFKAYKASQAFEQHLADLHGVTVEIFYIRRPKLSSFAQGKEHIQFWQQYIYAMGGTLIRIRSIN